GVYRCNECFFDELICKGCCLRRHARLPFHCVKVSLHFEAVALADLGLCVQFNHTSDEQDVCPSPKAGPSNFIILHVNGLHLCPRSASSMWPFPTTVQQPQTCSTFQLLHHFHLQSIQLKVSTIHFYQALEQETSNIGLVNIKSCYTAFLRMVRMWRHLKLLKQAGCGHDSSGAQGTKRGELAIMCPACPIPDINLPEGWRDDVDKCYLYTKITSQDANFRLSLQDKGTNDPGLGTGWAYFVEEEHYQNYLVNCGKQNETSMCTGLSAIEQVNTKNSKGLQVTGVGAVICAHHGFLLLTGIGDLQKGEQYANMDYILFSGLQGMTLHDHLNMYDIWCMYHKNLRIRHLQLPSMLQFDFDSVTLDGAVPKFHLNAHGDSCRTVFSLNFFPGVGHTDGEGIEHDWASVNGAA
ncbi:hypothetical protein BS47DRAFT_1306051, partial [Hydnum rufescens UP504]